MAIAYAAFTESCTFLLDEQGICRRALLKKGRAGESTPSGRSAKETAGLCLGAQYVASIDVGAAGGLVPEPRIGAPLLFAFMRKDGRIGVVRTGPVTRFESMVEGGAKEKGDSGVHEKSDVDAPTQRFVRKLPDAGDTLREHLPFKRWDVG